MHSPRIFIPETLKTDQTIELSGNAFNHSIRALRLKTGTAITLFNGQGGEFTATISDIQRKSATAVIGTFSAREAEAPLKLIIGQCISRGDKMDYTIQKSTELGASNITPLFSERCGVQLKNERLSKKELHWSGIAISACEQCGRNRIPTIQPGSQLNTWVENVNAELKLVLAPSGQTTLKQLPSPTQSVALLFGPEGGLSEQELQHAQHHGFIGIQLGPRILRTETAALTTLSCIQALWGDLA